VSGVNVFEGNDVVQYAMMKCGMRVESGKRKARFWLERFIERGTLM
jgi:hypothetical protein